MSKKTKLNRKQLETLVRRKLQEKLSLGEDIGDAMGKSGMSHDMDNLQSMGQAAKRSPAKVEDVMANQSAMRAPAKVEDSWNKPVPRNQPMQEAQLNEFLQDMMDMYYGTGDYGSGGTIHGEPAKDVARRMNRTGGWGFKREDVPAVGQPGMGADNLGPRSREYRGLPPELHETKESIFAPNHYCIHHGGVHLNGKVHMAEAVQHVKPDKNGYITHYDMRLSDGTILENVPAGAIQVTNASLAETHYKKEDHPPMKKEDDLENPGKADLDKDGELSSYEKKRGAAIEKNMSEATMSSTADMPVMDDPPEMGDMGDMPEIDDMELSMQENDKKHALEKAAQQERERQQSAGDESMRAQRNSNAMQRQAQARADAAKNENLSDKEWYDNQLFENLKKKWIK